MKNKSLLNSALGAISLYLVVYFIGINLMRAQSQQPNFNIELLANVDEYTRGRYSSIYGYIDTTGKEYAIIGTDKGVAIYSLEDPRKPKAIALIQASSTWIEMKTWKNYIYATLGSGNEGILIINMQYAPDRITWNYVKLPVEIGSVPDVIVRCFTSWIDKKGVLYLCGCNVNNGAVVMYDLNPDPESPRYLGAIRSGYTNDIFTRGDTLWNSDIFEGKVSIIDVKNKTAPILLNTIPTSSKYAHSCWLSDDGKYLFTCDEVPNANIDAYQVSNLNKIERLDFFTPAATRGTGVVPHHLHYDKGFLKTAFFTDGVKIIDASRPTNLVEVGSYDTYLEEYSGINGVSSIFPYFPSGILIASDMQTGLWVLKPTHQKACFLEGLITDANDNKPIGEVKVQILAPQINSEFSKTSGNYATGLAQSGVYQVVFYKEGYFPDTSSVTLENGKVTLLDVKLRPDGFITGLKDVVELPVTLKASPNPFTQTLRLEYSWRKKAQTAELLVYDLFGRIVERHTMKTGDGNIQVGLELPRGQYWVQVVSAKGNSKALSIVKQH